MSYIAYVGRIGGLAVALGIGVALASMPAVAAAKPPTGVSAPGGPNVAISIGGNPPTAQAGSARATSVNQPGSTARAKGIQAEANSFGANDTAIVDGNGSVAQAGNLAGGDNNFVSVDGIKSLAFSGSGNGNTITVHGNGDSVNNTGGSNTITVHGNNDSLTVTGDANTITVRGNQLTQTITGNGGTYCFGNGNSCHQGK
jgi:hypothetical protein